MASKITTVLFIIFASSQVVFYAHGLKCYTCMASGGKVAALEACSKGFDPAKTPVKKCGADVVPPSCVYVTLYSKKGDTTPSFIHRGCLRDEYKNATSTCIVQTNPMDGNSPSSSCLCNTDLCNNIH